VTGCYNLFFFPFFVIKCLQKFKKNLQEFFYLNLEIDSISKLNNSSPMKVQNSSSKLKYDSDRSFKEQLEIWFIKDHKKGKITIGLKIQKKLNFIIILKQLNLEFLILY
jgi:hypothetical protein